MLNVSLNTTCNVWHTVHVYAIQCTPSIPLKVACSNAVEQNLFNVSLNTVYNAQYTHDCMPMQYNVMYSVESQLGEHSRTEFV